MKIEVAPWIRDYVVDMDELYTELTLEKIQNKPYGPDGWVLGHYLEMFDGVKGSKDQWKQRKNSLIQWFWIIVQVMFSLLHRLLPEIFKKNITRNKGVAVPGERILVKIDPGMSKSTLVKKLAWDWAVHRFPRFSLVLMVMLKLVRPWETLEDAINAQIFPLQGLNITKHNLHVILRTFGNKCLLILDGLNENPSGQNVDVIKIIQRPKLYNSCILVTSRPHTTRPYECEAPALFNGCSAWRALGTAKTVTRVP